MKRLISMLLCLVLVLCLAPAAFAADGVTTQSLAGGSAVFVSMAGRTGDVALANGSVVDDAPAANMVSGAVAAVNGGFFNCYYNQGAAKTFPENAPIIHGVITKNGEVVNNGGENNAIAFTYDGKVMIDRVKVEVAAAIAGKVNTVIWGVNQQFDDDNAIMLFTPALTLPFEAKPDATVFTVQNDKVVNVQTGGTHTAAAGTKLLVYNRGALADVSQWGHQPALGDTIQFAYNYIPTKTADQAAWNNVKTAAAGGRMLVQNGVNVTGDASYNEYYDGIQDQSNTSSAKRGYVGQTGDGRVVFGVASGTFPAIADALIAAGVTNALSMDGGSSCFLYGNGSTLVPAGRKLAVVIQVVAANSGESKPAQAQIGPVQGSNEPSSWAVEPLKEAKALKLYPEWLDESYRNPITRREFCATLGDMLPAVTGQSLDQLRGSVTAVDVIPYADATFTDTDDYYIRSCAALRIVNGKGGGQFKPTDPITRQEAAAMMQRAGLIIGAVPSKSPKSFSDSGSFASWGREAIDFVTSCGIMNGTGDKFDPDGTYTREQTFITMLNAYHAVR